VSASQSSYRELAASPPQGKWRLEFLSPTAFRQQTGHLPLPLPSCLFRSAFDRWNAFCPEPLRMEESLLPSAEESVFPSQVEIRTRRVRREQGSFVGFTGRVELTMVRPLPPEAASQLTALLRFLTFAGVGHGSTRGWGQVELR
jgi:CRISPR-associated endoribonuclease Cas6